MHTAADVSGTCTVKCNIGLRTCAGVTSLPLWPLTVPDPQALTLLPFCRHFNAHSDKRVEANMEDDRWRTVNRSFNNWLQAYCIFASILGEKQPELCSGLFQHLENVLEAYTNV